MGETAAGDDPEASILNPSPLKSRREGSAAEGSWKAHWVPIRLTQSVIPIGAALFIIAELLSLPAYWRATATGHSLEHPEIVEES